MGVGWSDSLFHHGGFDAVIGTPPWGRNKLEAEWFGDASATDRPRSNRRRAAIRLMPD